MFKSKTWEVNESAHKGVFKKLGSGKPKQYLRRFWSVVTTVERTSVGLLRVRNVKNSAFFFIKSIVYLKSYINFEKNN